MSKTIKQEQLKLLLNDFELLAKTAIRQYRIANELLGEPASESLYDSLYDEAESNEIILDRLEVKVREEIVFTIFQFNPVASDLRKIVTYLDITTNLERVGDMLLNIIHYFKTINLSAPPFAEARKTIQEMIKSTGQMLEDALFSFSNEDKNIACMVLKEDDKVDEMYHSIAHLLQDAFVKKPLSREEIQHIIDISAIAHNLERIGDSATNIAEATIYLTDGKDIRHSDYGKP
jgi:phosphate transport system protein